jgi:Tol biopolymer transport system component
MRKLTIIVGLGVLAAMLPLGATPRQQQPIVKGLPTLPNASLLVGWPPFFLVVTNPHEDARLQPESKQPDTQDSSSLFPSISRDGKTVAYARLKGVSTGRLLAISTYSMTTGKQTEYATGEYSGSIAISPDGFRLAYPRASPLWQFGKGVIDNHLHIVDLRTGQQILGPEITSSSGPVFASWSPDSRQLAFSFEGEIRVWDSTTGRVRKIADGDVPAWSPSGDWIAYLPGEWEPDLKKIVFNPGRWGSKCLIVHPDGRGRKTLVDWTQSKDYRTFVGPPVWSPDSKTVLLNELDDGIRGTVTVHSLDLETLNLRTLSRKSNIVFGWATSN